MQSNLSINPQPSFKAGFTRSLINSAKEHYYNSNNVRGFDRFMKKVRYYQDNFPSDIRIFHQKVNLEGKNNYVLYAATKNMKKGDFVVLTVKDKFRKILEKFIHMSDFEFNTKMAQQMKAD